MRPPEAEAVRAEHAVLAKMDAHERVVALAAACIDSEVGTARQIEELIMVAEVMARHLDERDRCRLAALLLDTAIRLVTRWHERIQPEAN